MFAVCLSYFSIIAASAIALLLLIRWIGQLRNSDVTLNIAFPWHRFFLTHWIRPRNWPKVYIVVSGIILAVVCSRLLIFLLGGIWSLYFTDEHTLNFNAIWLKWDASHYLFIAENGYVTAPHDQAVLIAFYPLYPLLIKCFWFILRDYSQAALLVSSLSLITACFVLYKLVNAQFSSSTAAKAVLFLIVSPFSVFMGLVLTESLFLALVLTCFYSLRERRWLMAGVAGFFAALTKNQGILLLVPYLMEAIAAIVHQRRQPRVQTSALCLGLKTIGPALLVPAGFTVYILINYLVFGNSFQFLEFQKTHWYNSFGFFAQNIKQMALQADSYPDPGYRFSIMVLQPAVFVVALLLLFAAVIKRIPASTNVFSLLFLLVSFSPTWLISGARYTTALFFVPMLLAILATTTQRLIVLSGLSISLMSFFVIVYVEGVLF